MQEMVHHLNLGYEKKMRYLCAHLLCMGLCIHTVAWRSKER